MASRRPLIVNSSAGQIQELTDSDDLSLPNSNVTAQSFIGDGSSLTGVFPIGGIIMWSGSVASIPSGWSLCDGTNSTPDLRNRFVVGASSGTGDTTYPGLSVDATGGSADAVVVEHAHSITDPEHTHTVQEYDGSQSLAGGNATAGFDKPAYSSSQRTTSSESTGITSTNAEGVSGTNQNLPPYYALAFIMRTS